MISIVSIGFKFKKILDPIRLCASSLLNDIKDISGKACLNGVDTNDAFVNVWVGRMVGKQKSSTPALRVHN